MIRVSSFRSLAALGALAIALAACGGGGGNSNAVPSAGNPNFDTGSIPSQLLIKDWGESTLRTAQYVGPVSDAFLSVNVLVHQQNGQALIQYAADVSNPSSASYRKWLTPHDIATRFGASQSDYQAAADYFAAQGLIVGAWPQRMMLSVSGAQPLMERAFNTRFGVYQRDGQTFVAPLSVPHFSKPLPIDQVGRLVAYRAIRQNILSVPRAGSSFNVGYSPQLVRGAFDYNNAYQKGFSGSGVTVAIIATGPIDSYSGGTGDHDLDAFASLYGASVAHVTQVNVTGSGVAAGLKISHIPTPAPGGTAPPNGFPYANAFATPPPVTASCNGTLPTCNPEDGEAQLDVQQAASIAPGSTLDFYLAYNAADCTTVVFPNQCSGTTGQPAIGITEADPEIQQVIADNKADVISMSYGGGEPDSFPDLNAYNNSFSKLQFAALASEGIAAFASSGDDGSAGCLANPGYRPIVCAGYPSGDPSVTSVGGVTAYINSQGAIDAPVLAWGISTFDGGYGASGASGGGTSTFMPAPAWQQAALANSLREQPDVSLIGDPNTGVTYVTNTRFTGGGPANVGGTSVAAPEMAATWALVLSACKQHPGSGFCPASGYRLGNAAPYFYAIYKNTKINGVAPGLPYGSVFYDVLYGSNEMQSSGGLPSVPVPGAVAQTGYDQITGVGAPYAGHLIQAVTGQVVP